MKGRDGLLPLLTDGMDSEVMDAAGDAKIIANYAVGYNNIDIPEATRRGIAVTNTPGVLTDATADLAWTLLMATGRRVVESDRFTREGKFDAWAPMLFLGTDITGRTLGIVGAGRIGTAVAERAKGFRMRIVYSDSSPNLKFEQQFGAKFLPLDELLAESDFVTLHCPLTPETTHLIGAPELRKMKSNAVLVNTARGPVIDEAALVEALRENQIAGAGLDVYEKEPALYPGLIELDNVTLLPHTGSATTETRTQMALIAAKNIVAFFKGEKPPTILNPEVLS